MFSIKSSVLIQVFTIHENIPNSSMAYFHFNDFILCPGVIQSSAAASVAENRTNSHDG